MHRAGNSPTMGQDETDRYPLTGRFLAGRLRHAMTAEEKVILESLIEGTERFHVPRTLLRRGELATRSTLLIEGYVMRTITKNGQRFVVEIHVPGDFADLHSFALKRLDHDVVTLGETLV